MTRPALSQTSPTLLGRLRQDPGDQAAWRTFVERYGPRLHAWCREWHLQEADALDVTQEVRLRLSRRLRSFHYGPSKSFRAWLRAVTRNALVDFQAQRQRPDRGSGDSRVLDLLDTS